MVSGHDLRQLRDLLAIRTAVAHMAADDVGAAIGRERLASKTADEKVASAVEAGDRWYAHLTSDFGPETSGLHAARLLATAEAATAATAAVAKAQRDREASEADWREARARQRAAESVARRFAKGIAHRREESRLAIVADQVTFRQVRR